ncbi:hypothetical protein D3C86_1917130 [compost metagenome]
MRQAHNGDVTALHVAHCDLFEARLGRLASVVVKQMQHAGERRASFGSLAEGNDVHDVLQDGARPFGDVPRKGWNGM